MKFNQELTMTRLQVPPQIENFIEILENPKTPKNIKENVRQSLVNIQKVVNESLEKYEKDSYFAGN